MESSSQRNRLLYLDWLRGVAGIIMLQGHVFQAFVKPDLRGGAAYMLSQFFGGMPPALFLFLTGITLAFLMDSMERKGLSSLEPHHRYPPPGPLSVRNRTAVPRATLALQLAE